MNVTKKIFLVLAVSLGLMLTVTGSMASALPEKIDCSLKLQNSEISSCNGVTKDFQVVLENRVENPVRHLQHNVSNRKGSYTFTYMSSATSYRDTLRPIYYYQSQDKIDGHQIKLLLIGKDNIKLDDNNKNWKKDGTFYQCKGDCPYQ